MKKLLTAFLLTLFVTVSFNSLTYAQDDSKNLGIGVIVGEPTGLSLKSWTEGNNAFDLGVAWSFGPYDAINLHADYLWHNYDVFEEPETGNLPLYYGIGARVVLAENDAVIGARFPVGINYIFEEAPLDLFLELAPILNLAPDTDFHIGGGVGLRFYL